MAKTNDNPILNQLAELLHRQISVTRIEVGPPTGNVRLYRFHCNNAESVDITVKGTPQELVALHKQTRAYWDTFRSIDMPLD